MQLTIDTTELRRAAKAVAGFSDRRFGAAVATALTRTARAVEREWQQQFRGDLDRPTPLTQRAAVVTQARADNLEAVVQLRTESRGGGLAPAEYLAPQEFGGDRRLKRFEAALVRAGAMPAGKRAVPGPGARLDGFGNVSRGQIVRVLNQLAGGRTSEGYTRVIGRTQAKRDQAALRAGRSYVALPVGSGGLQPGVYERRGRQLVPVFVYVGSTRYSKRLRLNERGSVVAQGTVQAEADRALAEQVARLRQKIQRGGA